MGRRRSGSGGSSPASLGGPARTPKNSPVWETYRLVGTLDGHLTAYRHPDLPDTVTTATAAANQPAGTSILSQPARLAAPVRPTSGSWADHTGTLVAVFTGLSAGDLVLPVRLPQGAGQWARLSHFLADPRMWHKIDLVRVRDRKGPGGWRCYAHLLVHQAGYQSPANQARRASDPHRSARGGGCQRVQSGAGIVSRRASRSAGCRADHPHRRTTERGGARRHTSAGTPAHLGSLPAQHQPRPVRPLSAAGRPRSASRRQRVGGQADQQSGGPRHARADGVPARPIAATNSPALIAAPAAIMAPRPGPPVRPNTTAPAISRRGSWPRTATPSPSITASISTWARLWGKRIALFSPGMLVAALVA